MSAHRENILECGLQKISQLLLRDELKERWLQRVVTRIVEKLHVGEVRGIGEPVKGET